MVGAEEPTTDNFYEMDNREYALSVNRPKPTAVFKLHVYKCNILITRQSKIVKN